MTTTLHEYVVELKPFCYGSDHMKHHYKEIEYNATEFYNLGQQITHSKENIPISLQQKALRCKLNVENSLRMMALSMVVVHEEFKAASKLLVDNMSNIMKTIRYEMSDRIQQKRIIHS